MKELTKQSSGNDKGRKSAVLNDLLNFVSYDKLVMDVIIVLGQWKFGLCLKFDILLKFYLNFIDVQDKSAAEEQE